MPETFEVSIKPNEASIASTVRLAESPNGRLTILESKGEFSNKVLSLALSGLGVKKKGKLSLLSPETATHLQEVYSRIRLFVLRGDGREDEIRLGTEVDPREDIIFRIPGRAGTLVELFRGRTQTRTFRAPLHR